MAILARVRWMWSWQSPTFWLNSVELTRQTPCLWRWINCCLVPITCLVTRLVMLSPRRIIYLIASDSRRSLFNLLCFADWFLMNVLNHFSPSLSSLYTSLSYCLQDTWRHIYITSQVKLFNERPCPRCPMIYVDHQNHKNNADKEPMTTLLKWVPVWHANSHCCCLHLHKAWIYHLVLPGQICVHSGKSGSCTAHCRPAYEIIGTESNSAQLVATIADGLSNHINPVKLTAHGYISYTST